MKIRSAIAASFGILLSTQAGADEPAQRHGAIQEQTLNLQIGLTWVSGIASDARVGGGNALSTDFVVTKWFGDSMLTVYAEGSTTPPSHVVLAEGNGDAGTALDFNGNGRFQISELHMKHYTPWGEFNYGPLIDAASYLDASQVANDETSQFLAPALVNNTSIRMPDYTVGFVLHDNSVGGRPGVTIFIGGSHGLADNTNRSYSELFDLGAAGKGLFAAVEGYLNLNKSRLRLGVWGRSDTDSSRGIYANADLYRGKAGNWNLRWGQAEGGASDVSGFTSLSWEKTYTSKVLGLGFAEQSIPGAYSTTAEAYLRFTVDDGLELTPSVQWLQNPGFDASGSSFDARQTLYQLRLSKAI